MVYDYNRPHSTGKIVSCENWKALNIGLDTFKKKNKTHGKYLPNINENFNIMSNTIIHVEHVH